MAFSSLSFLFVFLPFALGGYYLLPRRLGAAIRNYWLLACSLLFYAYGEPTFVLVMLLSIAFNFVMANAIDSCTGRGRRRQIWLWVAIFGNLAVLGVWKYANFAIATLREFIPLFQGCIPQTSIVLPIGISFFTFQAMSYVIDVYNGKTVVQRNPFYLALYIALFPQLIAGPIVRYSDVCVQLQERRETLEKFARGIIRFLIGLNKKMLLANTMALIADDVFDGHVALGFFSTWLGAVCYTLQIYFDFSGYSDMAIGLARMFGFEFPENFNYPYVSKTITEFWRRWHISLGSWFRDYVYFPLGGSRVGRLRLIVNLMIVWSLTGVWHGANWTFILWGALYGVLIAVEKGLKIPQTVDRFRLMGYITWPVTMLFVIVGWVLFRSSSLSFAVQYLREMFSFSRVCDKVDLPLGMHQVWFLVALGALASVSWTKMRGLQRLKSTSSWWVCLFVIQLVLATVSVSQAVLHAHNPFIYFHF